MLKLQQVAYNHLMVAESSSVRADIGNQGNAGVGGNAITDATHAPDTDANPQPPPLRPRQPRDSRARILRWTLTLALLTLAVAAILGDALLSGGGVLYLGQRLQTFVTIFLGIFIEAAPFLLAGSLVSGMLAEFVDHAALERVLPRQPLLAAVAGASMGIFFPVCECGVVPVVRRLYEKGMPIPVGVAFLLAAPVINPIVIASTWAAFGGTPIFWGRLAITWLVAVIVALLFQRARPGEVLLPELNAAWTESFIPLHVIPPPLSTRTRHALNHAGDDFLDMGRYLVIGSLLAAAMQTLVPQSTLLAIGQTPVLSVVALQLLAFVLSVCSTVDAFLALAFTGVFSSGAIVAFLTFGPMVDIKSSTMFLGLFQKRVVLYLILLPLLLTMLAGIFWNLNLNF